MIMQRRIVLQKSPGLHPFWPWPVFGSVEAKGYDPLIVDPNFQAQVRDLTVHDASRNRDIPVRLYLPASEKPAPIVLFSHELGGSRAGSEFLGEQWAARGYLAVFVQHPGSDDAV